MWLRGLGSVLLVVVAASCVLARTTGDRLLVVVDDEKEQYNDFLQRLDSRGYAVTVHGSADAKKDDALFPYDERAYDHIALLVPELKGLKGALSPQSLVRFAEEGGNLFVALSPRLSEAWRDFAREFGLEFAERNAHLVDHFGYDAERDTGDHTAVRVGGDRPRFLAGGASNPQVFSNATLAALRQTPLTYRGTAHWVGPNPLAFPLLVPPSTAYVSETPTYTDGQASGIDKLEPLHEASALLTGFDASAPDATAALASAIQLRTNSARVSFLGSVEALQPTGRNDPVLRAVVDEMLAWTFQKRGVLRVARTAHARIRASEEDVRPDYEEEVGVAAKTYRIKDRVYFALDVQQYEPSKTTWGPAPLDLDLQLSVAMLDPYVTVPLSAHIEGDVTRYSGAVQLPDRHGVFTLRVNWKRNGWTYLQTEDVVPVRPFNHDEYPRMLSSSWPYVAGAFSTLAGLIAFATLWLVLPVEKAHGKTA